MAKEIDAFPEKKEQNVNAELENKKEVENRDINNKKEEEVKEIKNEEPKKEIVEVKPPVNLKGKKSKKEPRVKPEKEKEESKVKENKENSKKESVLELEKELEQETKEINTEVETELKKTTPNNTLELTTAHQETFGIDPTPSKQKITKEKAKSTNISSKTESQSSKNHHTQETPMYNPYSMFPMYNPMMMPNADPKQGQAPMFYMVPVPVDPSQMPKDYWKNMSMFYPMMQNMYPPNLNNQNNNSKK